MPLPSRALTAFGWLLAALSLTAFAVLSIHGRAGHGATPVFDPRRFVALRQSWHEERTMWLVAVNLGCPHCRASLPGLIDRARHESGVGIEVLLVDAPARPPADSIAALPIWNVWWDSTDVWRRGWHRSAYGEVLVFDAAGRLVSVRPPESAP